MFFSPVKSCILKRQRQIRARISSKKKRTSQTGKANTALIQMKCVFKKTNLRRVSVVFHGQSKNMTVKASLSLPFSLLLGWFDRIPLAMQLIFYNFFPHRLQQKQHFSTDLAV